ncbi:MAG: hypothetical protein AMXMBFR47_39170 [Planctomycetota bacterium]
MTPSERDQDRRVGWVVLGWRTLSGSIALGGLVYVTHLVIQQTETRSFLQSAVLLIAFPGALGGLLFSMRERSVVIPSFSHDSPYTLDPGFLADIWFGIAGAFIAFLVVPGKFDYDPSKSPRVPAEFWTFVKISGLAVAGGYGGRALIAKALSDISRRADSAGQVSEQDRKSMRDARLTDSDRGGEG